MLNSFKFLGGIGSFEVIVNPSERIHVVLYAVNLVQKSCCIFLALHSWFRRTGFAVAKIAIVF